MQDAGKKHCIVTGATSGHGKACAVALARMGYCVTLLGRNPEKLDRTRAEILTSTGREPGILVCDLSRCSDIERAAGEYKKSGKPLHLLLNNAGVVRRRREETPDGFEMTFAVNYLSMYNLTLRLLDLLLKSGPARIVNVASDAHRISRLKLDDLQSKKRYGFMTAYARSKSAVLHFTIECARELEGSGVTVNAVDPGPVASGIADNNPGLIAGLANFIVRRVFPSPERAAKTALMLCTDPRFDEITGKYYRFMKEKKPSLDPGDPSKGEKLCRMSAAMTRLDWPPSEPGLRQRTNHFVP